MGPPAFKNKCRPSGPCPTIERAPGPYCAWGPVAPVLLILGRVPTTAETVTMMMTMSTDWLMMMLTSDHVANEQPPHEPHSSRWPSANKQSRY